MSVPDGILSDLTKMGAYGNYETEGDTLIVSTHPGTSVFNVIDVIAMIYGFDPTQRCEYRGYIDGRYHFQVTPIANWTKEE